MFVLKSKSPLGPAAPSANAANVSVPRGATRSSVALILGYILLFIGTVFLDQTTKIHAEKEYMAWSDGVDARSYRGDQQRVMTLGISPSFAHENGLAPEKVTANWLDFHLTYVRNPGAAWGSFSNLPDPYRLWSFYAITVLASGLIIYLFRSSHPGQRLTRVALVLILAGAIGNFIDRLLLKYVIDWVQFHWRIFGWEYNFPVFNWADISINVGVGLMLLDMALSELALKRQARAAELARGQTGGEGPAHGSTPSQELNP